MLNKSTIQYSDKSGIWVWYSDSQSVLVQGKWQVRCTKILNGRIFTGHLMVHVSNASGDLKKKHLNYRLLIAHYLDAQSLIITLIWIINKNGIIQVIKHATFDLNISPFDDWTRFRDLNIILAKLFRSLL